MENEYLHKRVEELETDNQELEDMLEQAKSLAEMISVNKIFALFMDTICI